MMADDNTKLKLLLSCLRMTCKHFKGDEQICGLTDDHDVKDEHGESIWHVACNCYGDINNCDLSNRFKACLD